MNTKRQSDFTNAMLIEQARDEAGIVVHWRALMFEIDHDIGAACLELVVEADTPEDAAHILLDQYRGALISVKVQGPSDRTPDAVRIGNHWVVWPDALSTAETAMALATRLD